MKQETKENNDATQEKKQIEAKEENKQETKEEIKQNKPNTEDKKVKDTTEKNISNNTKEKVGTLEQVAEVTPTVPTKKEEMPQPKTVVEQEVQKTVQESKVETKKIDLSKYDYYEESKNGSYKGFIKDNQEMNKLKSLIDTCISEFGYKNVKVMQDSSLPRSGLRSFTANKTNVENAVYDSEGFTICYYAVKEYHIAADGTETLFQTRSYIKVK